VAWTRGERLIVLAGVPLAGALLGLPWHRVGLSVADDFRRLGLEAPAFRPVDSTAVEAPNAVLGRGALVVALLMVAAVLGARLLAGRRPVAAAWEQGQLIAGAAVLGLLVAKLNAGRDFLTPGAWVALALGALLAYAGFVRSQEVAAAHAR